MTTSTALHGASAASRAELLTLRLGSNAPHLSRESATLMSLLADGERLLDAELAAIGYGKPGLLAITDLRVIHVYVRRILPGCKLTQTRYADLRAVEAPTWKSYAGLTLRFRRLRRAVKFALMTGGPKRALDLQTLIRSRIPETP